jgi:hypothetical protein
MPHLVFHMAVARELAGELKSPVIDEDRGSYYMGATGPDMHILSGTKRHSSHFFDLDCVEEQNCVGSFFNAFPELRGSRELSAGTAAFVGGYLTHLVIDEVWITDIYRPFFGPESPLRGDAQANIMDRILQYDMDLERRQEKAVTAEIREELLATPLDVRVAFADRETLRRWRDVAVEMLSRSPGWDRFRYLAGRFLRNIGVETEEQLEEFLETVPSLLEKARNQVGENQIEASVDKMAARSLGTLKEYLG